MFPRPLAANRFPTEVWEHTCIYIRIEDELRRAEFDECLNEAGRVAESAVLAVADERLLLSIGGSICFYGPSLSWYLSACPDYNL